MSLRMSRRKWEKMTRAERAAVEAARAAADHRIAVPPSPSLFGSRAARRNLPAD
jgi:hypothetical protein